MTTPRRKDSAVAASHVLATRAGEEVLERGGNAYDAAIAVSAALTVVQPHMNGLGGDFFAVVQDGNVRALNASGFSAAAAQREVFVRAGRRTIPPRGALSAFMVPGLPAAWELLRVGSCTPLPRLLDRAAQWAREGFFPTRAIGRAIGSFRHGDSDWRATYGAWRPGDRLRQPALGRTLETLGRKGIEEFYRGGIARRIASDQKAKGGLLRKDDLAEYAAEWRPALSTRYGEYEIFTNPPNSQGATLLYWLDRLGPPENGGSSPGVIRRLLRTLPDVYAYRARCIGDPRVLPMDPRTFEPAESVRERPSGRGEGRSDTTAFAVHDGTVGISAIQSNYMGFGSGISVRGCGINLSNRGAYFTLDANHHNVVGPRKQTFHTLMATVARGPRTLFLSSMGGDVQPQAVIQVLLRLIESSDHAQAAVEAPRFAYPATIYRSARMYAEAGLRIARAQPVRYPSPLMGIAQTLVAGERMERGIDPRGDGLTAYPPPPRG